MGGPLIIRTLGEKIAALVGLKDSRRCWLKSATGTCLEVAESSPPNPQILFKSKVIPLQALTGPEGSGRLRFPDFKTIGT
jgi:hypothetical protein